MGPELPLSVLEFEYRALDPIAMPVQPGVLWHGVFGKALHLNHCIAGSTPCRQCLLLHQCDYPYLFRRIAPNDSEMLRGKEVPVPHVFRPNLVAGKQIEIDEIFSVDMILVGVASTKTPAIIRAMQKAGKGGLGASRGKARLVGVRQIGSDADTLHILQGEKIVTLPRSEQPGICHPPPRIGIDILTPYKPAGKQQPGSFDVGHFIMAIIRRISLLQYFYTDKRLQADFPRLKSMTTGVDIRSQAVQWQAGSRYSPTHGKSIDTGGWLGHLELDIHGLDELWPYLWLGQWLNVGKNASMGFGCYVIAGI
jgi:hypothetical protein